LSAVRYRYRLLPAKARDELLDRTPQGHRGLPTRSLVAGRVDIDPRQTVFRSVNDLADDDPNVHCG
jgi:hypothetical protein